VILKQKRKICTNQIQVWQTKCVFWKEICKNNARIPKKKDYRKIVNDIYPNLKNIKYDFSSVFKLEESGKFDNTFPCKNEANFWIEKLKLP
jgi:hypothetical protein